MASPAALRLLALSALLLLCAPTTFASVTPRELVASIQTITAKGQALQGPANSITIINGPLIVIGLGPYPVVIKGFSDMVTSLTNVIQASKDTKPVEGSDAKAVADAVREMVRVHQVLLNILTGKAGLFTETVSVIGPPVAQVLRAYEGVIDMFLFQVADIASAEAKDINAQRDALDGSSSAAIKAYTSTGFKLFQ